MKTDQQWLNEFLHADSIIDEMKVIQAIRREQYEATMDNVFEQVEISNSSTVALHRISMIRFEDTQD